MRKHPRLLGPGRRPKKFFEDLQGDDMWFENYQRARAWFRMNDAILAGENEHLQAKGWYHELKAQSQK